MLVCSGRSRSQLQLAARSPPRTHQEFTGEAGLLRPDKITTGTGKIKFYQQREKKHQVRLVYNPNMVGRLNATVFCIAANDAIQQRTQLTLTFAAARTGCCYFSRPTCSFSYAGRLLLSFIFRLFRYCALDRFTRLRLWPVFDIYRTHLSPDLPFLCRSWPPQNTRRFRLSLCLVQPH